MPTDSRRFSRSLAPAGTRDGLFRIVYRFENEQLLEVINRTVHSAALGALVETAHAYRFYFGVYVQSVGRVTPVYMALIDPFRRLSRLSVAPAQRSHNLEPHLRHLERVSERKRIDLRRRREVAGTEFPAPNQRSCGAGTPVPAGSARGRTWAAINVRSSGPRSVGGCCCTCQTSASSNAAPPA